MGTAAARACSAGTGAMRTSTRVRGDLLNPPLLGMSAHRERGRGAPGPQAHGPEQASLPGCEARSCDACLTGVGPALDPRHRHHRQASLRPSAGSRRSATTRRSPDAPAMCYHSYFVANLRHQPRRGSARRARSTPRRLGCPVSGNCSSAAAPPLARLRRAATAAMETKRAHAEFEERAAALSLQTAAHPRKSKHWCADASAAAPDGRRGDGWEVLRSRACTSAVGRCARRVVLVREAPAVAPVGQPGPSVVATILSPAHRDARLGQQSRALERQDRRARHHVWTARAYPTTRMPRLYRSARRRERL